MAVVNNYENVVARTSSGEIRNAPTYTRTFTVRCDNPDTSMVDIANAPGIKYGDPHPHDASCFVTTVDVDADGDSMLIYTVSYSYTRPVGDLSVTGGTPSPDGTPSNTPPDPLQIPDGYWAGSSTLETKQSGYLPGTQSPMRMTNGRPITSGVLLDYASEQINMTNYYGDWGSVQKIASSVDCMNSDTWPVGSDESIYGFWAWKIMSCTWSFKQQSSEQTRLEYYEVTVTLQRKDRETADVNVHDQQGWPLGADKTVLPGWFTKITSAGFQEIQKDTGLRGPIKIPIVYKDCDGKVLDPSTFPDNENCLQYPSEEDTTEEFPLDIFGEAIEKADVDTKAAIIVPWTEQKDPVSFTSLFGNGPPYAPKKGPL